MEFCPSCNVYMARSVATGARAESDTEAAATQAIRVVFACPICAIKKDGVDSDTLWYSGASEEGVERSEIIVERASHDLAGKHVLFDCECGRSYATLVRIGKSAVTRYVCECGIVRNSTFTIVSRARA